MRYKFVLAHKTCGLQQSLHKFLLCHFKGEYQCLIIIRTRCLRNLHRNRSLSYTRSCCKDDKIAPIEPPIGEIVQCPDVGGYPRNFPFGKFIGKFIRNLTCIIPDLVPYSACNPFRKGIKSLPDDIGRYPVGNLLQSGYGFNVSHSFDVCIKKSKCQIHCRNRREHRLR